MKFVSNPSTNGKYSIFNQLSLCAVYNTTNNTGSTHKKNNTMTPPAVGFQRLQKNRWVRSPDVARWCTISATRQCNFNVKITHSLFYNYLFHAQLIREHAGKRCVFLSEYLCFFIVRCVKSTRTNPSCTLIFFCRCIPCPRHVLTWFRTKGRAMVTMFGWGAW